IGLLRTWRQRWSRRSKAQNLVEYGLTIAAVALIALAGFTALGRAQALYWKAVEPNVAAPTPGPGSFVRPTSIDINCDHHVIRAGDTVNCQVTVADTGPPPSVVPQGTVTLWIDNGSSGATCTLTAGQCPVPITWLSSDSDVGPRTITPIYVPNDGIHSAP